MNPDKYISGIYNYCDRWCEKCLFRNKCFLYEKNQKRLAKHKAKGEDPYDWDIVMQDVKESFDETLKLLHKFAKERGIDLDALSDEEYKSYDPSNHPLMKIANNYLKMTHKFLEKLRKAIQAEGVDLTKRVEIIPSAKSDIGILRKIVSAYEVISWYHTLVPAKLHRALQGKMEAKTDEFAQSVSPAPLRQAKRDGVGRQGGSDAGGSAKVAYLGIIKSMNALKTIYDWDEDFQDSALTLLAKIDKLRKGIDNEFPGHRTFKRLGFDD